MSDAQRDFALDLMRRLPPSDVEKNLSALIDLVPDLTEDLLADIDQPLKIAYDAETQKDYLLCDYNRDGDSYRSPWSNKYDPPLADGQLPSAALRQIELQANNAFDVYRDLYYEGGVSSVYLWDQDDGFAGVVLLKKTADVAKGGTPMKGTWDSIHVFEVEEKSPSKANYRITSTIMLKIETNHATTGLVNCSGSLTRQQETNDVNVNKDNSHVSNLGQQIEKIENSMRATIETIYFGRTKDIVGDIRKKTGVKADEQSRSMQQAIRGDLGK
eukprot:TRINITY_DN16643_c0_g1_i1.p1 TRINITY_DN16643_c0_g1~~TRINITY_DN16643_c0_g1_i1.p1  ORF type:complete len:272 (-),score=74.72 TRINITY_DN16643_c0_g1_i1:40-855(-)